MVNKKVPSEKIQTLLKQVYDDCQNEDRAVRERQIREWRRLKLLWEGFSRIWYSEVAHDWRIWDQQNDDEQTDQSYYDQPVNVFKAYLESIIAALSVTVPPVKVFPDDAENTLDIATARAGDKIGQLIYRHNNVPILWLHALFISVTEGMTAVYAYPREDYEYGTYIEKEYEEVEEVEEEVACPQCGYTLDENAGDYKKLINQQVDKFNPGPEDVEVHDELYGDKDICPACLQMMIPQIKENKFVTTRLVNSKTLPKSRVCMEVYGGLYVKIPNYAKRQSECPYLIFSEEKDYSLVMGCYEHLKGKKKDFLQKLKGGGQGGAFNSYEQWARLSPQYQGEYPNNVITVNKAWIRPDKFNILSDENDIELLKSKYPDGVKVTYANDQFAEAENESLDDMWTLSENPLAEFLHFEPLGQSLTSIQSITNDLISLVLQTIEHGIGQTFADPAVLNFNAYEQTETTPGGIFPATPKTGKSIADGFYQIKTASLSSEVLPFSQQVQSLGQLVSGSLPSLFGGNMEGGETASQYSMSRAQALQRLQNQWKVYTTMWKTTFSKAIPMYIDNVKEDERDVQRDDNGNFINTFIRKAELEGKIGKVELDANENLPMTWGQIKDTVEKLMLNQNPIIQGILMSPENIPTIHEALGLIDFVVPGEDYVLKAHDDIKLLLNSEPLQTGDPEMPELPSLQIDPDYDNPQIAFEIIRKWVISEAGRQTKVTNEAGYRNVLLFGKMYKMEMERMALEQQASLEQSGASPDKKPNPKEQEAPIMGESNVSTVA